MAKIRHIAIMSEDPLKLADFYKTTFGLKEVHRHPSVEGGEAVYLSDDTINLAIIPARGRPEGIHHFGFHVESIPAMAEKAMSAGAKKGPEGTPPDGRFAEVFILDPVGTRVDLSEHDWKT